MPSSKEIISDWINTPGTQLVLQKLVESAERTQLKYDTSETFDEFKKHQIYRAVVLRQIPKMLETIVNKNETQKWNFWKWLGNSLTLGEQK